MKWTKEQEIDLQQLCTHGKLTNTQLAQHFNCTVRDIYAKRSQMGITIDKCRPVEILPALGLLTSERCNGISCGYWSPAQKDKLVQRLGKIENTALKMLQDYCDFDCRKTDILQCDKCYISHAICIIAGGEKDA